MSDLAKDGVYVGRVLDAPVSSRMKTRRATQYTSAGEGGTDYPMNRRRFMAMTLGLSALLPGRLLASRPTDAQREPEAILLQTSPVAGFQYHDGERVWHWLAVGQNVLLSREPENPYDGRAIAIVWQGRKIGYVPRAENAVAAGMLDRGETLLATISRRRQSDNPWERLAIDIALKPRA